MNLLRGILGSSASNLYRADVLKRFPFRTGFGTAGDLAWGLEHAGETRFAIVPRSSSTFMFHPKSYAKDDYAVSDFNQKCLALAREAANKYDGHKHGATPGTGTQVLLSELLTTWEKYLAEKGRVVEVKRRALWWLLPGAWQAHLERARALRALESAQANAMLELAARVAHDSRPE
jgi:hypothetical protein